jgi:5S rRNA maturation endonuclease (ribonuclease M5)
MEFDQWLEKLKKECKLIIVEGSKDKKALESLDLTNIITLRQKPLFQIVEEVAEQTKDAIILTDLDKEGKMLFSKLSKDLQKLGVRVDNRFREFLFKETKLRQIEGIRRYIAKLPESL